MTSLEADSLYVVVKQVSGVILNCEGNEFTESRWVSHKHAEDHNTTHFLCSNLLR